MKTKIVDLYNLPFSKEDGEKRKKILSEQFSNEANAKQQVKWIWG